MTMLRRTRDGSSNRGVRPTVACFDCNASGSAAGMVRVYRRSDGAPIDWQRNGRDGAIVVYVHRAGAGCNKGRTPDGVRESAKEGAK